MSPLCLQTCKNMKIKGKSLTYTDNAFTRSKHALVELGKVDKLLPRPVDILKDQALCRTSRF